MNDLPAITDDSVTTPGTVVGGKFVVEGLLGAGGMGFVVAARHRQLGTQVALKFLKPALRSPELVRRFVEEARAAAHLHGEHVAHVLDVGTMEDGAPYIVMEHLLGRDLAHVIDAPGATPIHEAAEWIIQACAGLAEAHAQGLVHRDVKPENLFLVDHQGWRSIKVLDFGISKGALGSGRPAVFEGAMGSPSYMAPEQLRAAPDIDHRADIWSLGVVLFELLTKATPFGSDKTVPSLARTIFERPPTRLRALRPDAPASLEEIVRTCLQKERCNRFANAAELAIALLPHAPGRARVVVERAAAVTTAAGLAVRELIVPEECHPPSAPDAAEAKPLTLTTASSFGTFGSVPPPRNAAPTLPDMAPLVPARSAPWNAAVGAARVLAVLAIAVGVLFLLRPTQEPCPLRMTSEPVAVGAPSVSTPAAEVDAGAAATPPKVRPPVPRPTSPRPFRRPRPIRP